jgi:hypothetical protein
MARSVFFSFHYQNDIWRVNQVRNSNIVEGVAAAGFRDASLWEETKKRGDAAINKLIDDALNGTTVTAILIGSKTAGREYIDYEIKQSYARRNGLLGIYVHNIKNEYGRTDIQGRNPFSDYHITNSDNTTRVLSDIFHTYDWVYGDGYHNFGDWVEAAYKQMNP